MPETTPSPHKRNKLLVLRKLEDFLVAIYPSLKKFPKSERFTLAQKIQNTSLECIDHVLSANFDKANRHNHLLQARVKTERVLLLIRAAHRLSMIDIKHYETYSERLIEIAKMLAGWARAN